MIPQGCHDGKSGNGGSIISYTRPSCSLLTSCSRVSQLKGSPSHPLPATLVQRKSESTMDIYTDPNFDSIVTLPDVLTNLTFLEIATNIPDQCIGGCAPFVKFAGDINGGLDAKTLPNIEDARISISLLTTFIRNCTTPGLLQDTSNGQIIDWFFNRNLGDHNDIGYLGLRLYAACFQDYCKALKWQGNPDISGVGVCSKSLSSTQPL